LIKPTKTASRKGDCFTELNQKNKRPRASAEQVLSRCDENRSTVAPIFARECLAGRPDCRGYRHIEKAGHAEPTFSAAKRPGISERSREIAKFSNSWPVFPKPSQRPTSSEINRRKTMNQSLQAEK
jgi:hypothetical protein